MTRVDVGRRRTVKTLRTCVEPLSRAACARFQYDGIARRCVADRKNNARARKVLVRRQAPKMYALTRRRAVLLEVVHSENKPIKFRLSRSLSRGVAALRRNMFGIFH